MHNFGGIFFYFFSSPGGGGAGGGLDKCQTFFFFFEGFPKIGLKNILSCRHDMYHRNLPYKARQI